jgi:hypothetical protein
MTPRCRAHRIKPDRRRARACCRDGCTEAMMLAHGFTIEQICELVYGGATMTTWGRRFLDDLSDAPKG